MQKITRRLLSALLVLAMVLTLAPAGILAVETKATETTEPEVQVTPGQANLPDGVQAKIDAAAAVKTWAEEINAAVKADTGTELGWEKVNKVEKAKTCPACGQTDVSWVRASGWNVPTNGANEAGRKYYHYVVDRNMAAGADFVKLNAYSTVCVLWLDGYTVTCKDATETDAKGGDVVVHGYKGVLNMIGNVNLTSTSTLAPLFNFTNTSAAAGTVLNLYGGTYTHSKSQALTRAIISSVSGASSVINIYNDTVIGPKDFQEPGNGGTIPAGTGYCNVRLGAGTVNMYGGTIRNGYAAAQNQGWNVMMTGGTFNMYGGTIQGGSGINGATGTNVHNRSAFNMYGGEIKDGKAYTYQAGGQFYVGTGAVATAAPAKVATATLYGGKITGGVNPNTSLGRGGNINIAGSHANLDASVGYGKLVLPEGSTALISGGKTGAAGYGGNIMVARGGELQVAGGFIQGGLTEGNNAKFGGNISLATGATATISGGTISGGKVGSNGGNIYANTGSALNITGGTITKGVSGINGGNIWSTISFTASNATITDGKAANGGNMFVQTGPVTLESTNTISGGTATAAGGNIFAGSGCVTTIKCDVTDGSAATTGGNVMADYGSTIVLDNVTVSGGTAKSASLSGNLRINEATLKLVGDTNIASSALLDHAKSAKLVIDSTFSGDVYVWHTAAAIPGEAVPDATCTGEFTGVIKNGNWIVSDGIYANIQMMHDGAEGLKYPAQGVFYSGVLTPAASSQAAVDAFVAAMKDETVEEKPQYAYVNEDVVLSNGDEVVIYPEGDITVTGNGTVYGVDRSNDAYTGVSSSITAGTGVTVAEEVTAGDRTYIALSDSKSATPNKYTFHRIEAVLQTVTVRTDNAGLYYKAKYRFDSAVKDRLVTYGVLVRLNEEVNADNATNLTADNDLTGYENATLTASSHGVFGVFKDANDAATNQTNGAIKLYGNPYIAVNTDNTVKADYEYPMFDAESVGLSMYDAMVMANTKWSSLSDDAKTQLNDFVNTWNAKGAWTEDLLKQLTKFDVATAE